MSSNPRQRVSYLVVKHDENNNENNFTTSHFELKNGVIEMIAKVF